MVKVECIVITEPFIIALEEVVIIGTKEEGKGNRELILLDRHGEGATECTLTDVATSFLLCLELNLVVLEACGSVDENGAEVLVFEGHPLQCFLNVFVCLTPCL